MEKYAIYKYKLVDKPRRDEVVRMPEAQMLENMEPSEKFELLFGQETGSEVRVQKFKKNNTSDKYPCRVLNHDSHIILLRLENKKNINIWEQQPTNNPVPVIEKKKRESTPYCYIFIDNRPGAQIIVIQSDSPAWRNTLDIKDILQDSLNWLMDIKNYGIEVNIMSKMMPSKFWEYVDKRRRIDKVQIKSLIFSFTNYRARPDINIKQALSSEWRRFDSLMTWIDNLGGDKGELKIIPSKNNELMRRKMADIKHMVEICANSNYALSLTFSDNVTYKCNQEMRAEIPMHNTNIRVEFENKMHDMFADYRLVGWLDDVIVKTNKYEDVEEIRPKPGRKDKKQVS